MPKISLVVCLYKQRDLIERLLQHADGCYDDLVVVHDGEEEPNSEWRMVDGEENQKQSGDSTIALTSSPSQVPEDDRPAREAQKSSSPRPPPAIRHSPSLAPGKDEVFVPSHRWPEMAVDFSIPEEAAKAAHFWKQKTGIPIPGSVHELVAKYGGRFFEGPRCWQQEPHWPFAWSQARNDWILRLDADEFPSNELRSWLQASRKSSEDNSEMSGFTCIWPLWDGNRARSDRWPSGRLFLFHRMRVRFFGMAEQVPICEKSLIQQEMVLNHQPVRKSYGIRNIVFRKQAYRWRSLIAVSLTKSPLCLPRWRFSEVGWPEPWDSKKNNPIRLAVMALIKYPIYQFLSMRRASFQPDISACLNPGIHHFLLQVVIFIKGRRLHS